MTELNKFVKTLNEGKFVVRVGIMGNKAANIHKGSKMTNADIGAIHEFGSYSDKIPARSFLRMPLFQKSKQIINEVGKRALSWLLKGNKKQILIELGKSCEGVIQDAFNSGGFGSWIPLKETTIKRKIGQNTQPLINTSQLRRSITSQVIKK